MSSTVRKQLWKNAWKENIAAENKNSFKSQGRCAKWETRIQPGLVKEQGEQEIVAKVGNSGNETEQQTRKKKEYAHSGRNYLSVSEKTNLWAEPEIAAAE